MPGWSSRLEVQVNNVTLTPITTFTTTFGSSITPIHSIEADNVGVIKKNAATLYKLAIAGSPFDVALTVQSGADWVFTQLLFRGCYITSANPSNVTVGTTSGQLDTVPVATFSGIVTDFAADADVTQRTP